MEIATLTVQEIRLHQKKWNEVLHTGVRAVFLVHFTNYCKENIIFPHGYHVPHPVNCKASALFFSLQQHNAGIIITTLKIVANIYYFLAIFKKMKEGKGYFRQVCVFTLQGQMVRSEP